MHGGAALVPVFEAGVDGYDAYRIPAVVVAADSTVLAFAEGRRANPSDDGEIDLVLRRSLDRGATWGPVQVVMGDGANKWGNPVPMLDRRTGRIVLNTTRTGGSVTLDDIQWNRPRAEDKRRAFVHFSDDHGATWSEPREITAQVRPDEWRHFVGGPGHGIQLEHGPSAGRFVIAGNHSAPPPVDSDRVRSDGRDAGGHCLYSDDGGHIWHLGGVDEPGDGLRIPDETTLVELADGTIYFSSRDQGGSPGHRLATVSHDGGTSFGRPYLPVAGVATTKIQGSLARLPDAENPIRPGTLVLSAPDSVTARVDLTLWVSRDDGAHWSRAVRVHAGPSGYSDLALLQGAHREIGVLFECGEPSTGEPAHQRIGFVRVPERLLAPGAGELQA